MSISNKELLQQTKAKFANFLEGLIDKYVPEQHKAECVNNLTSLKNADEQDFTSYILKEILPYEKTIKLYVEKLLPSCGIKYETVSLEEHIKFEKFVLFFIKMVNQKY